MSLTHKLAFVLLTVTAIVLAAYQAATVQLVFAPIWFCLIMAFAMLIALSDRGVRGLILTACISAGVAALAPLSWHFVYPKRDEFLVPMLLGLVCVWMPTGAGIGLITWFLVSLRAMRRKSLG